MELIENVLCRSRRCPTNRSQQMRPVTLPALEFIGRFLQHVLPQGCAKVRHYGICSSSGGRQLDQARTLLKASLPAPSAQSLSQAPPPQPLDRCPHCCAAAVLLYGKRATLYGGGKAMPKLLERVCEVIRIKHYSLRTEQATCAGSSSTSSSTASGILQVRIVNNKYNPPIPNRRFGAQAAKRGASIPLAPITSKTPNVPQ